MSAPGSTARTEEGQKEGVWQHEVAPFPGGNNARPPPVARRELHRAPLSSAWPWIEADLVRSVQYGAFRHRSRWRWGVTAAPV